MSQTAMMPPLLFLSLAFLLSVIPCSARHIIAINSTTTLQFSSLAWDAASDHFVAGSSVGPAVYGIPDDGVVRCLICQPPSNSTGVSVAGVAVDHLRHRLIVAFSNPSSIAVYDSKSYQKIYAAPLPELGGAPGGVTVDLDSGEVLVSGARRGVVLKVGPEGDMKKIVSELKISDNQGLGGIAYLSQGYILAIEPAAGNICKVDTVGGTVQEVFPEHGSKPLAASGHAIALQTEKSVVIAANRTIFLIEADDNTWAQAFVEPYKMKLGEGETAVAVAMREGKKNVYVLVKSEKGYRIEEAPWGPLEWYIWAIFILGGISYFLYIFWLLWEQCEAVLRK